VYKDSATFYPALDAFLAADDTNARFLSNLAFDENGEIEVCRARGVRLEEAAPRKTI